MGITGTEVAKAAADIILLDDNFSSIITAMKWGRNIYASIRKFLQFQLTVNVVAMFMAFIGGVVLGESPLNSVQMLWVNLIMDTFAALALATEKPTNELLEDKPHNRNTAIVNPNMWRNIVGQAIFQIGVLSVFLFAPELTLGIEKKIPGEKWTQENGLHYTMIFNIFVMMQVFNEINARKIREGQYNIFSGIFTNPLFLTIEVLTIVVQIALVYFGGEWVKCSYLTLQQHGICIGIGSIGIIWGFFVKFLPKECFKFGINEKEMSAEESQTSTTAKLKGVKKSLTRQLSRVDGEKSMSVSKMRSMNTMKAKNKSFKEDDE